jgi:hypothetical protein
MEVASCDRPKGLMRSGPGALCDLRSVSSFTTPLIIIVTVMSLMALLGLMMSSGKMSLARGFWAATLLSFANQSCERLKGEGERRQRQIGRLEFLQYTGDRYAECQICLGEGRCLWSPVCSALRKSRNSCFCF